MVSIPNIVPELKKVIQAVQKRDDETLETALDRMADKFERAAASTVAEQIRFESEKWKQRSRMDKLQALPTSKGVDMAMVYTPIECREKAKRLVVSSANRLILDELLEMHALSEVFYSQDVPIPTKILMFGPPGTGKTLTAYELAYQLDLPLVVVRLDTIIDSHLGETAVNIRKIFDFAKKSPCILFLDEFDAIARDRKAEHDVKEMSRVVNTLLQCMDEFDYDSFIMAATNLDRELDAAVWRRFDTRMTFSLPDEQERIAYLQQLITPQSLIDYTAVLADQCSFADMEQIVMKAKRKAILQRVDLDGDHLYFAYKEYFPDRSITYVKRFDESEQYKA